MSQEQIIPDRKPAERTRQVPRWAVLVLALASISLGLIGLGMSFVMPQESWSWNLRRADIVALTTINAVQRNADASGLSLKRQGSRLISIITPPLKLSWRVGPVAIVRLNATRPQTTPSYPTRVRLLWQTEDVPEFHSVEATTVLSQEPCDVSFALPFPAARMHRLGVQLPDDAEVCITSISLPSLSTGERFHYFGEQLLRQEPIANHSVNFLTGPRILGHGLSYYLICFVLLSCGCLAMMRFIQRRRVTFQSLAVCILLLWFIADAHTTLNLFTQARSDVATFGDRSWEQQIALMEGPEIAWAYQQLMQQAQPGDTFSVLSDDTFTPSHRLAYLLTPQRIFNDEYHAAHFIVVINASKAHLDEARTRFRYGTQDEIVAEVVAELSPNVYLLRTRFS